MNLFKVIFRSEEQLYELYAKKVYHGDLPGFIVIEELVFGESSTVVVDPTEEKLKAEFSSVERIYVPIPRVIRIDEVTRRGKAKIIPLPGKEK